MPERISTMHLKKGFSLLALMLCSLFAIPAAPQSLTSGDITGTVSDPSGAVLPKVQVIVKNNDTSATQQQMTNTAGTYRFSLCRAGQHS